MRSQVQFLHSLFYKLNHVNTNILKSNKNFHFDKYPCYLLQVVNVLTSNRELVDLIKNVDTVFHSIPAGSSKSMLNTLYRFVPSIREQLQVKLYCNANLIFAISLFIQIALLHVLITSWFQF